MNTDTEMLSDREILGIIANSKQCFERIYASNAHTSIMRLLEPNLQNDAKLLFSVPAKTGHYSAIDAKMQDEKTYNGLASVLRASECFTHRVRDEIKEAEFEQYENALPAMVYRWVDYKTEFELEKINAKINLSLVGDVRADLILMIEEREELLTRMNCKKWEEWKDVVEATDAIDEVNYFKTGLSSVDIAFSKGSGFRSGNILVIGAPPGCGKTTWVHQILVENSEKEHCSLYFSLENQGSEIRYMFDGYYEGLGLKSEGQKSLKMSFVDDQYDIDQICGTIRECKRVNPNLGMVVIDYAQLIQVNELKGPSLYQRLESVSQKLKELKKLNIFIVILSQIDKDSIKGGKLGLASLKGGVLAESCTYCIIMNNKSSDDEQTKVKKINLNIVKNRHGEVCERDVYFSWRKKEI